jgi:ferritin
MLSKKMAEKINEQVGNEMYSAYLYLAMSLKASEDGWKGFATWFMAQYHEEMHHAMKFIEYLQDQGAQVKLSPLKDPGRDFAGPKDMFEKTYKHEQFITKCIHELAELALAEKDHASYALLQWYVNEQVEEEKNDTEILDQLSKVGDNVGALFMLDAHLRGRKVGVPTDFTSIL